MAKLQGPLFSLTAKGTLGKTITYQGRPSGTAAFLRTIPYDQKTVTQRNIREYVSRGVFYWQNLGLPYQTLWNKFVK